MLDARNARREQQWLAVAAKRYAGCTLENLQRYHASQDVAYQRIREYASNLPQRLANGESLILFGPKGSGKDHAAAGVIRPAFMAGRTARRVNGPDLQGDSRDAMCGRDTSERELVERYSTPDWLWLSDPICPGGDLTSHQATILYRILEGRYAAVLPSVVTVNAVDLKDLETRLGPAILDRLRHNATIVHCAWPSFRAREVAQ